MWIADCGLRIEKQVSDYDSQIAVGNRQSTMARLYREECMAMTTSMNGILIGLIGKYQRYVSSRKGYGCAYRVCRGGCSCSEHGKRLLGRVGMWRFGLLMMRRFRKCALAAREARVEGARCEAMRSTGMRSAGAVERAGQEQNNPFGGSGEGPAGGAIQDAAGGDGGKGPVKQKWCGGCGESLADGLANVGCGCLAEAICSSL